MIWKPVIEDEDDEERPWVWCAEINHPKYGRYAWISNVDDDKFEITTSSRPNPVMTCKTLASAKRWVSMNIGK